MKLLEECVIETQHDDDIETDEDTLTAGIRQCQDDLYHLHKFIIANKHFRGLTNVVKKWRDGKKFWFSDDGR